MQPGFVKLNRTVNTLELLKNPKAFTLLALIALRAKRTNGICLNNLQPGEALIGDYKKCGLTRQEYRTALKKLENLEILTIKTTNKGTIVKLINTDIFDINTEESNQQVNQRLTIKQPSGNHQATTNKKAKKEKNIKEASRPTFFDDDFSPLDKETILQGSRILIETAIVKVCLILKERKRFENADTFAAEQANEGRNKRAILHALQRCLEEDNVKHPAVYCKKIIAVEDGNYNENEHSRCTYSSEWDQNPSTTFDNVETHSTKNPFTLPEGHTCLDCSYFKGNCENDIEPNSTYCKNNGGKYSRFDVIEEVT